jgi:hypothetical protein
MPEAYLVRGIVEPGSTPTGFFNVALDPASLHPGQPTL